MRYNRPIEDALTAERDNLLVVNAALETELNRARGEVGETDGKEQNEKP